MIAATSVPTEGHADRCVLAKGGLRRDDVATLAALMAGGSIAPTSCDLPEVDAGERAPWVWDRTTHVGTYVCTVDTVLSATVSGIPVQPDVISRDAGNKVEEDRSETHSDSGEIVGGGR